MRMRNLAFGLSMTLGVQLMPGYWVKDGEYVIPNSQYMPKGGPGYTPGGSDYQNKTGGGSGGSTGASGSGNGGNGNGSSAGLGLGGSIGGGGSAGSGRIGDSCGLVPPSAPLESGTLGPKWEDNLNDALPYDWVKKFWLCGCPAISMEGSLLYWEERPIIMCIL